MDRFLFHIGVLVFSLLLAGCGEVPAPDPRMADTRTVIDGIGRTVTLPGRVDRVVSLAPSITEMIFAAGAAEKLVGVTTYCDFPKAADAIEKIGDTQSPNIERIVALQPDVIFVSKASQLESSMPTLERRKIAVFVIDSGSIEGVTRDLAVLGSILGTEESARARAATIAAKAELIRTEAPVRDPRPRVIVQISGEPLFTAGKDSFITSLVEQAGGHSVTADVPTAFPKLSRETAAALQPDVIILSDSEDNRTPNSAFDSSPAKLSGRICRIDPDLLSRPGPRLVDGLAAISECLHGSRS